MKAIEVGVADAEGKDEGKGRKAAKRGVQEARRWR